MLGDDGILLDTEAEVPLYCIDPNTVAGRTAGGRINKAVPYLGPVLVCRQSRARRNCRSAAFAHVDGPSVQSIQPIQSIQAIIMGLSRA
jgi:hypothetical protein